MAFLVTQKSTTTSSIFKRLSFNLIKSFNLSTSTQNPTNESPAATTSDASKKRKKKRKNLIEVAHFLPNWGVGYHMAKSHWTNVTYEITKINLYKNGKHGKAWGLAYKDGLPAPAPKKISGVHKRCWKYIPKPLKLEAPKPEAQEA